MLPWESASLAAALAVCTAFELAAGGLGGRERVQRQGILLFCFFDDARARTIAATGSRM